MEKDLVTIIIAIYNAEKYLDKTINSVLNQTYKNFELILIDDGSKDNSLEICEKYKNKDNRIRLIKQENLGVSASRNKGLEIANGEFICFMDADDYIEQNMLEEYIGIYKKYNYDLIVSGYFSEIDLDNNISYDKIYLPNKRYSTIDQIKEDFVLMWDKHLLYNIWNKFYKKSLIDEYNIRFIKQNWGEDIEFNREYLLKINTLYNSEKCFYHYVRGRKDSITGKYIENLYDIRIQEDIEFRNYFEKFGIKEEEYREFCARRHIERTLGCIENLFNINCKCTIKEKYKEIKRIIKDEKTEKYLKEMKPNSKKVKILLIPYKIKSVFIAITMGKTLSICREKLPKLFNAMKNRR